MFLHFLVINAINRIISNNWRAKCLIIIIANNISIVIAVVVFVCTITFDVIIIGCDNVIGIVTAFIVCIFILIFIDATILVSHRGKILALCIKSSRIIHQQFAKAKSFT